MEISFDEFKKIELRIGEIISVEEIEGSEKLIKLKVSFGDEERQILAGIKKYYSSEDLVGNKFIFVTNLEKRKIMGLESQGMILAAGDENGNPVLICPDKDAKVGSIIR
ncbi:MAG: methionine--tRNA ligase subunit beta [Candidatus Aenigmarchaeota archaeon]|nr:methionine--tRNA ligase subunit beta [Candidatus Aenigmarchaeota archaeon]